MVRKENGFTLIELLIVVAIIAILAAIAIPNFLQAQIRAKVSRVKADTRTAATALEAYRVDYSNYPPMNDGPGWAPLPPTFSSRLSIYLTTPIAYITSIPHDEFMEVAPPPPLGVTSEQMHRLTYYNYNQYKDDGSAYSAARNAVAGEWLIYSWGPDRAANFASSPPVGADGVYTNYDPTNGTVSTGNIIRTQVDPQKYDGAD